MLVDRYATVADQTKMLAQALSQLQLVGQQHIGERLLLCLPVSSLMDLDTEELDKSRGVVISLNHYWKLVGEGKVEHRIGISEKDMKLIADSFAGTRPRPCPRPLLITDRPRPLLNPNP